MPVAGGQWPVVGGRSSAAGDRQPITGHWAEAYVGRPHVAGAHDCADLVEAVTAERFGRRLGLPGRAAGPRGRDAQVAALAGVFAAPCAEPREGDAVLMRQAGRRRAVGHHIGVWCAPGGAPHVLHCLAGAGTCLHALGALPAYGLEAVGVYRWL